MTLKRRLKVLDGGTEEEGTDMDGALRVAFASTDMKCIDQHFGSAGSFVVYAVDAERARMLEVIQFGQLAMDGNHDKLTAKMNALDGCDAVYSQAIGSNAIARLSQMGVQPVRVGPGTLIEELLETLQGELREGPTSWLARAVGRQKDPGRFDAMDAEGWDE